MAMVKKHCRSPRLLLWGGHLDKRHVLRVGNKNKNRERRRAGKSLKTAHKTGRKKILSISIIDLSPSARVRNIRFGVGQEKSRQ